MRLGRLWVGWTVAFACAGAVWIAAHLGAVRAVRLRAPHSVLTNTIARVLGVSEDLYNFGVVVPGRVYRWAQPDETFLRHLYDRYGVRRVISLNGDLEFHAFARDLGMTVDVYHWDAPRMPEERDLKRVLDAMEEGIPVLVHCVYGRDRTGYAIGAYRLWRQGWPVDRAFEELRYYGHDGDENLWIDTALGFYRFEPASEIGGPETRRERQLAEAGPPPAN